MSGKGAIVLISLSLLKLPLLDLSLLLLHAAITGNTVYLLSLSLYFREPEALQMLLYFQLLSALASMVNGEE